MSVTVIHADSRDALRDMSDASVDACVCDPPYALTSTIKRWANTPRTESTMPKVPVYARATAGFSGQKWDTGETAFDSAFWAEVLRVLKPGAHLIAFGSTRTYHRLVCAIEDAGFEIRDSASWNYGSVSHAIAEHANSARSAATTRSAQSRLWYSGKADELDRLGSKHLTVKPVDLMAYLCRLVCPPGGTILDPFAGSGTTGMACMREGFRAILIEREAEYVSDIKRRIAHVRGDDTPLFAGASS